MTNILLILIFLALWANDWANAKRTERLMAWLDSYAEMTGDLLRELIDTQDQEENPYTLHGEELEKAVESAKRKCSQKP